MITVKRLKEILSQLPDDATCMAYEGEGGIGISITLPDDSSRYINASDSDEEDDQPDFPLVRL